MQMVAPLLDCQITLWRRAMQHRTTDEASSSSITFDTCKAQVAAANDDLHTRGSSRPEAAADLAARKQVDLRRHRVKYYELPSPAAGC